MLAQLPTAAPAEIGVWLMALAAIAFVVVQILSGLNQYKQWAQASVPASEKFVTKSELDKTEGALLAQFNKHEDYTHKRLHELADSINTLTLKFAGQPNEVRHMIDASITPLARKIDALMTAVVALGVKLGVAPAVLPADPGSLEVHP